MFQGMQPSRVCNLPEYVSFQSMQPSKVCKPSRVCKLLGYCNLPANATFRRMQRFRVCNLPEHATFQSMQPSRVCSLSGYSTFQSMLTSSVFHFSRVCNLPWYSTFQSMQPSRVFNFPEYTTFQGISTFRSIQPFKACKPSRVCSILQYAAFQGIQLSRVCSLPEYTLYSLLGYATFQGISTFQSIQPCSVVIVPAYAKLRHSTRLQYWSGCSKCTDSRVPIQHISKASVHGWHIKLMNGYWTWNTATGLSANLNYTSFSNTNQENFATIEIDTSKYLLNTGLNNGFSIIWLRRPNKCLVAVFRYSNNIFYNLRHVKLVVHGEKFQFAANWKVA